MAGRQSVLRRGGLQLGCQLFAMSALCQRWWQGVTQRHGMHKGPGPGPGPMGPWPLVVYYYIITPLFYIIILFYILLYIYFIYYFIYFIYYLYILYIILYKKARCYGQYSRRGVFLPNNDLQIFKSSYLPFFR